MASIPMLCQKDTGAISMNGAKMLQLEHITQFLDLVDEYDCQLTVSTVRSGLGGSHSK